MTTCAAGASVAPGHSGSAEIVISRALWEQLTGTASSWLDPILDTFKPTVVTVSDLCTLNVDDPADLSLFTIATALSGNPFSLLDVEVWAKAKLSYLAFQANCVCNAAVSPCYSFYGRPFAQMPDFVTYGGSTIDAGMRFVAVSACAVTAIGLRDYNMGGGGTTRTFRLWDLTTSTLLWSQAAAITGAYQEIACTTVTTLVPGHNYAITKTFLAGDSTQQTTSGFSGGTNADLSVSYAISNYPGGSGTPTHADVATGVPLQVIVCPASGPPPAPTQPVQPTDLVLPTAWTCGGTADICTRLSQISDRLDWLRRDVTLMQRQSVPFAYLLGTAHPSLTGHGIIAVSAILGASVSLTTVPASWGRTADTPRRLVPSIGQLVFSTADGDGDAQLLHYDQELILGVSGAVTTIKYSFRPGVVATITPLLREF